MRRFQIPNAALVAGLAVLLSGCSGETPTAPSANGGNGNGGGNGSCTVLVSMSATTQYPVVGSGVIVRATVTRSGVPVPDGGSVQYSTDLGLFGENGLNTISKTTSGGVADVTVFSSNAGTAHVKAVFDCANAQINLNFGGVPDTGPFISSLTPTTGSCAGGDAVTILGGRFGSGNVDVFFGGVKGSIMTATANTQITVTTPRSRAEGSGLARDRFSRRQSERRALPGGVVHIRVHPHAGHLLRISPTTGPNDTSTRVSIFGTGFQFPMQVFLTAAGAPQLVEAQVSDIALTTIVFKTHRWPDGPNACQRDARRHRDQRPVGE